MVAGVATRVKLDQKRFHASGCEVHSFTNLNMKVFEDAFFAEFVATLNNGGHQFLL